MLTGNDYRLAREALGLTIEQMCNRLTCWRGNLLAIESDDFAAVRGDADLVDRLEQELNRCRRVAEELLRAWPAVSARKVG